MGVFRRNSLEKVALMVMFWNKHPVGMAGTKKKKKSVLTGLGKRSLFPRGSNGLDSKAQGLSK